jgi:hypothetical protein
MSRSNPQLTNPATRFFEWSGSKGKLQFWDKEQEKNIEVPLPFKFAPLDQLSTITGYSKRDESGYWSNEVRNITNDKLIVKTKHGVAQEGLYSELADVRAKGAKYAKSIYIAYKTKQGWEIGNIKAHGSALSAWIDFTGTCVPENGMVTMDCGEATDAPTGEFYPPTFTYESCTPEENNIAIGLDRELQVYLKHYIVSSGTEETYPEEPPEPEEVSDSQDAFIDSEYAQEIETLEAVGDIKRAEEKQKPLTGRDKAKAVADQIKAKAAAKADIGDEPINLDDIPF